MTETKNQAKYKNNLDSAFSLLFIGIIGVVAIILIDFGIISLSLTSFTKIMINIVMGTVFTIFIITGIISYITAKKLKTTIQSETTATDELIKYITENITKDIIDNALPDMSDFSEEEKYMQRTDKLFEVIKSNTEIECDDEILKDIIEEQYDNIF